MNDALLQIERTKKTDHPLIVSCWRAMRANRVIGFGMFSPWSINELDEEWEAVFDALHKRLEEAEENAKIKAAADAAHAKNRR